VLKIRPGSTATPKPCLPWQGFLNQKEGMPAMKQIRPQDIEKLRQEILGRHDQFLENYAMLKQVSNADHKEMLARLERAEAELSQLLDLPEAPTGQDPRVRALFDELNTLRLYFGAPTGRPLEKRGVDFVEPHVRALLMLFHIDKATTLYVEMIRTNLALLEYQIEQVQDISECLSSLTDSISLCRYREQFTGMQDSYIYNLGHYLMQIHQLLHPMLFSKKCKHLHEPISRLFLEMAVAFFLFECGPEETDPVFCDSFILSLLLQLLPEEPDRYTLQCCHLTALWLWEHPLQPEQKEKVVHCYNQVKEALGDA
jgi:hypothetical protein